MTWDYLISNIIWTLIRPSNLVFIVLVVGIWLILKDRRKAGLWTLIPLMIFYLMVASGPLTNWLMIPLEQRFSVYTNDLSETPYSGIIVLAGAEVLPNSSKHNQVTLSGAGERLIEAAKLARIFPTLPIIFCGGIQIEGMMSETEIARKFFQEAGIDLNRLRFDDKSYNTYSNAIEAKKLIRQEETGKWLLVTSAFHMPRSVGAYRRANVNIQPYPVDYRSTLSAPFLNWPNAGSKFYELDFAVHEWVGLLAYYLSDRSKDLFPKDQ